MMRTAIPIILVVVLSSGCVSAPQRDATGRPPLERLATAAPAQPQTLDLEKVAAMENAGYSIPTIVQKMRQSGTRLPMDEPQRRRATELGASRELIEALVKAEAEAREADRLTAEADRAATARERREREALYARPYYHDPFYDPFWPHPYFGYGAGRHYHGWGLGLGWGW